MSGIRREGADDATTSIATGSWAVLGASPANDFTNTTASIRYGRVKHKGDPGTQSIVGIATRFSINTGGGNTTVNCLLLAARAKRRSDGIYKVLLSLYKLTGTGATPTVTKIKDIDQVDGRNFDFSLMELSVDTAGAWEVLIIPEARDWVGDEKTIRKSGTDSALATAGSLEDGRVAVYSCIQSVNESYAFTEVGQVTGSASATTPVQGDVIRASALGAIGYQGGVSDAFLGGAQVAHPHLVGSRLYLPPGTGELVHVIRRGDSDVEPDTGHADQVTLITTHYPAWATLPDALE